jgi:hypothetical protein
LRIPRIQGRVNSHLPPQVQRWLLSLLFLGLIVALTVSWLAWLGGMSVPLALLTSGVGSFSATVTLGYAVRAVLRS